MDGGEKVRTPERGNSMLYPPHAQLFVHGYFYTFETSTEHGGLVPGKTKRHRGQKSTQVFMKGHVRPIMKDRFLVIPSLSLVNTHTITAITFPLLYKPICTARL